MKKVLCWAFLLFVCETTNVKASEWMPYVAPVYSAPLLQQVQYVPVVTMVPVIQQYVPVTTYQNVVVEHRQLCIFKRYEVLVVPKTVYVPVRY